MYSKCISLLVTTPACSISTIVFIKQAVLAYPQTTLNSFFVAKRLTFFFVYGIYFTYIYKVWQYSTKIKRTRTVVLSLYMRQDEGYVNAIVNFCITMMQYYELPRKGLQKSICLIWGPSMHMAAYCLLR